MNQLKQVVRFVCFWLMLCGLFLGSGRAASFGLGDRIAAERWGGADIKSHQAMCSDATGHELSGEWQDRLSQRFVAMLSNFVPSAPEFKHAFFQADPNQRIGLMDAAHAHRTRHAKSSALKIEHVSNPNLDLSVFIAQRHKSCSRLQYQTSRALGSAPADSFVRWRDDRPHVPLDPKTFTLEYCEQAMRDNPIDTAVFDLNMQRAIAGKRWRSVQRHTRQSAARGQPKTVRQVKPTTKGAIA